MEANQVKIGGRVEAGDTQNDYDVGAVRAIDGDMVTVAWDNSKQTTLQHASVLRPALEGGR